MQLFIISTKFGINFYFIIYYVIWWSCRNSVVTIKLKQFWFVTSSETEVYYFRNFTANLNASKLQVSVISMPSLYVALLITFEKWGMFSFVHFLSNKIISPTSYLGFLITTFTLEKSNGAFISCEIISV